MHQVAVGIAHDEVSRSPGLCPKRLMERRAGRYRAHLLLQASQRGPLQRLLAVALPELGELKQARRVRWSVDVDPVSLD